MDRRQFSQAALIAGLSPSFAWAQGRPVEGQHYRKLRMPQPLAGSSAGGEVHEFFWYGCGACFALEAPLQAWLSRKPAEVQFKRTPAVIRKVAEAHQRIFYTLEAMGLGDKLHARLFNALQVEQLDLSTLPDIQAFVSRSGFDGARFAQLWNSFSVDGRCRQAQAAATAYEVDGVPWLVVNGQYATSPVMAKGNNEALAVVDYLLKLKA
ncbi:thiol:disulfide interchange protein DsbA/DsbL [Pelomonas sp. SE-A7]|uniref:thiol:disulfide interchange protein DsbA/DsbL n=1 Tax=Pelomonas sp. SE-A7 TaxID=3054953 RepID=UPI00259CBAE9|nr:thiol:disulfide interchange protein DsbA/DsbL [Pelomonas sp. SE-A7]MDM4766137.1 thiol:disulfide interchange protein DsbA/DsbL [Pelomonas sp. SE-A7]